MLYSLILVLCYKLIRGLAVGAGILAARRKLDRVVIKAVVTGMFPIVGGVFVSKAVYDKLKGDDE